MRTSIKEYAFWLAVTASLVVIGYTWVVNGISIKQIEQKCQGSVCSYDIEITNTSNNPITAYVSLIGFTKVGYGKNASERQVYQSELFMSYRDWNLNV